MLKSAKKIIANGELRRFIVVGGIGFFVDGGLLTLLTSQGIGVFNARAISFLFAVSVTWLLNRSWTFLPSSHAKYREYVSYFLMQLIGALINLGIFYLLILAVPDIKRMLLIPLACGAAVSLVFNYVVSKFFIFKRVR